MSSSARTIIPAPPPPAADRAERPLPIPIGDVPPPRPRADLDIGWRDYYVRHPDGRTGWHRRPLDAREWAHPREDDVLSVDTWHSLINFEIYELLLWAHRGQDDHSFIISDVRVKWRLPAPPPDPVHDRELEIEPEEPDDDEDDGEVESDVTAPDFLLISNLARPGHFGTFVFADYPDAVPDLAIEISSLRGDTRRKDLGTKVRLHECNRVPQYVIVDRNRWNQVTLINYLLVGDRYVRTAPNRSGRVYLEALGCWLGVVRGELRLYDRRRRRILRSEEVRAYADEQHELRVAAERRADEEAHLRVAAERRADEEVRLRADAERRADEEASLRADAERLRADAECRAADAEAELARLRRRRRRGDP